MIIGCASVLVLYAVSEAQRSNFSGFYRDVPPHVAIPGDIIDLKFNSYGIAGLDNSSLYLNNSVKVNHVLKISRDKDFHKALLGIQVSEKEVTRSARLFFNKDQVTLFDGTIPFIGNFSLYGVPNETFKDIPYFLDGRPYLNNQYLIRMIDTANRSFLIKINGLIESKYELTKQIDGFFCTEGDLVTNSLSPNFVYIYRYRNQFLYFDSTLKIIFKGTTIDTVSTAKIHVSTENNGNVRRLSSPPVIVNKSACIDNGWLYVHSALKAENESDESFREFSAIDVYSLNDGKYKLSFYLPSFRSFKVRDFKVYNNTLYAIQDQFLCLYKINIPQ